MDNNNKSINGNNDTKMTIQDVKNVLYSKEFWEAQRSYIGAKRNMDIALREARFNLERASYIDQDVKSIYGNGSNDQKTSSKWRSPTVSENKSNIYTRSNSTQGRVSPWNQTQGASSSHALPTRSNSICGPSMQQLSGQNYGNIGYSSGVGGNHFSHRYGVPLVGNKALITPSRRTSSVELSTNGSATGIRNGRPQFYIVGRTVNSEPSKK